MKYVYKIKLCSLVAQRIKHLPAMWETWVRSLDWEDPLENSIKTHSSSCLENSHGQRSLVGYSSWGHKEWEVTQQLNTAQK